MILLSDWGLSVRNKVGCTMYIVIEKKFNQTPGVLGLKREQLKSRQNEWCHPNPIYLPYSHIQNFQFLWTLVKYTSHGKMHKRSSLT